MFDSQQSGGYAQQWVLESLWPFILLDVLENNLVNDRSGVMAMCVSSQLGKKGELGYRDYK